MVILATPTAVKVTGVTPWIHHTRVKTSAAPHDKDIQKLFETPRTHSRSASKINSPAVVTQGAD